MTWVQRSVSDPCQYRSCYLSQCGPGSRSRLCTRTVSRSFSLFHHIEKSASIDCYKVITRQAVQKTQQHCHHEESFIGELLYILHLVHRCLRTLLCLIFKTEVKNITNLQYLHFHTFKIFACSCFAEGNAHLCFRKRNGKKCESALFGKKRAFALCLRKVCICACEKKCTFTLR
jgi:hypothetical protein